MNHFSTQLTTVETTDMVHAIPMPTQELREGVRTTEADVQFERNLNR